MKKTSHRKHNAKKKREAEDHFLASKESIMKAVFNSVPSVCEGHEKHVEAINGARNKRWPWSSPGEPAAEWLEPASEELIKDELMRWFNARDGKRDKGRDRILLLQHLMYMSAVTNPEGNIGLTITHDPKKLLSREALFRPAGIFGQDRTYAHANGLKARIDKEFYEQYSLEELSGPGPDEGNSLQISLTLDTITPGMFGPIKTQADLLANMQNTFKDARILSPFEAIARWFIMDKRGAGIQYYDERTIIRNFDLPQHNSSEGYGPGIPVHGVNNRQAFLGVSLNANNSGHVTVG